MTAKERLLVSKLLDMAADSFCNHGCNDLPDDFWENWSIEEIQELHKEFHDWNGDPEEYSPTWLHLGDSSLMAFMAHKIIQND